MNKKQIRFHIFQFLFSLNSINVIRADLMSCCIAHKLLLNEASKEHLFIFLSFFKCTKVVLRVYLILLNRESYLRLITMKIKQIDSIFHD